MRILIRKHHKRNWVYFWFFINNFPIERGFSGQFINQGCFLGLFLHDFNRINLKNFLFKKDIKYRKIIFRNIQNTFLNRGFACLDNLLILEDKESEKYNNNIKQRFIVFRGFFQTLRISTLNNSYRLEICHYRIKIESKKPLHKQRKVLLNLSPEEKKYFFRKEKIISLGLSFHMKDKNCGISKINMKK